MNEAAWVGLLTLVFVLTLVAIGYSVWRDRQQTPAAFRRLSRQVVEMAEEQTRLALRLFELELMIVQQESTIQRLARQVVELGGEPLLEVNQEYLERAPARHSPLLLLHGAVTQHFNGSELNDLIFRLGLSADGLEGGTREERARALVEWAMRHGKLADLLAVCRELRPLVEWPVRV